MPGEKIRWEQHENTKSCFEQILEASHNKTAAVWPLPISQIIQDEQNMLGTASEVKTNL